MKWYIIIMYTALMLLTGCSGQQAGWQTGDVTLVRAIGVDRTQAAVRISAATGWQGEGAAVLQADGTTITEGVRELGVKGTGFVHFGHVNQVLLGETFARDGVEPLLDFVARDRRIGPGVRFWVLLEGEAAQVLTDVREDVPARLERLAGDRGGAAPKLDCTATRLMSVLARRGSVPVPALRQEGDTLQSVGYAILRQGRLVGFLDREQSLGVELLCGHGADQIVALTLPDGEQINLRTERVLVRCMPIFEQGRLQRVELRCSARLDVAQGAVLTAQQRQQAVQQAELELCRRMAAALAFAQFWDADFVGLEQKVRGNCSDREWDDLAWQTEFRALSLRTVADVQVNWPPDMMEGTT